MYRPRGGPNSCKRDKDRRIEDFLPAKMPSLLNRTCVYMTCKDSVPVNFEAIGTIAVLQNRS